MENKGSATQNSAVLVPGVSASYRNGWGKLRKYFLELFLISIIAIAIGIPSGMGGWSGGAFTMLGFLGIVYSILICGPVDYGVSFAYLEAARGDKLEIKDMFEAFKNYWNAVLASILVGAIIRYWVGSFDNTGHNICLQVSLYTIPCSRPENGSNRGSQGKLAHDRRSCVERIPYRITGNSHCHSRVNMLWRRSHCSGNVD